MSPAPAAGADRPFRKEVRPWKCASKTETLSPTIGASPRRWTGWRKPSTGSFSACAPVGAALPLSPGLGSRLREISGSGENRDLTAAVMVREALESLDDVQVGEGTTAQQGESLTISIRLQLAVGEYEIEVGVPYGQ